MSSAKDLVGTKIGQLQILKRKRENNRTYYYCKCDCENELWIRADSLKTTKSCGCLAKKTQFKSKDITNQRFGRLIALKSTDNRDTVNGSVIWECKCDCENPCYISQSDLSELRIRSCGCLSRENSSNNIKKAINVHLEKHIIEHTNIPVISRIIPQSNNTSGIIGVRYDKSRNKWIAQIRFQNKIYFLGRYENKEDAIKARKEAEEKYHKSFLELYNRINIK